MPVFTVNVTATSNTGTDTEDSFVEILAAAGSGLKVKRVKVYNQTAAADTLTYGRLVRASTAGATGTAGTATKVDDAMRASSATVLVKNGTNADTTGTVVDTVERFSINGRSVYEWVPSDIKQEIAVAAASYFKVLVANSAASQKVTVDVTWED